MIENVQYRPITVADFDQFYGADRPRGTVKGIAFLIDGEVSGVAGVELRNGFFYAFSDIKENANVGKLTIWRCAVMMRDWLRGLGVDVYACASIGSDRFLMRLGFIRKGEFFVMEAA